MRRFFSSLWALELITLIVFPLLTWPVLYFTDTSWGELFYVKTDDLYLLPNFISAGIIFGLFMIWLSELKYFEKALARFANLLSRFKINLFHAFFISFCAGFGEEIFFRGGLQPILGIWITAILFIAVHGYFSLKNFRINVFALVLTGFIVLLGWAADRFSLWHAIAGHFAYDFVMLMYYRRMSKQSI